MASAPRRWLLSSRSGSSAERIAACSSSSREFIVQPAYDSGIEDFIRPIFEQSYTMSFENYPVEIERLKRPEQITLRPKPE